MSGAPNLHKSALRAKLKSPLRLWVQYAVECDDFAPLRPQIRRWTQAALQHPAEVTVRLVGEEEGRALNRNFRGKDDATNVLTFVYDNVPILTGDIVLCTAVVNREAREQGKNIEAHYAHLIVHGVLHLQGYDHEAENEALLMESMETQILIKLGYADPYATSGEPVKAMEDESEKPGWLERLGSLLLREPEDREQLIELLHSAYERNLLDADALSMIEGVLQVSEAQVRDIMIPRSQMDLVDINDAPEKFIPFVVETAHSRFPVIDENRDDVIGILLAKDLLRYYAGEELNVREMLRPAVFIPESKRLNVLLKEFRSNRNHIAIVVDEYGGVAGLVTIEDVLEQIVGEIEDEYDFDETEDNIIRDRSGRYRVKALTEVADFNEAMGTSFSDEDFDTVGGLVISKFGRLPTRGEVIIFDNLKFHVLRADSRRLHTLLVEQLKVEE